MEMVDEIIVFFIENNYIDAKKKELYTSLSILEKFGLKFYQDSLLDLLVDDGKYESIDKQEILEHYLKSRVLEIINEHGIIMQDDSSTRLEEINNLGSFLFIIQRLEDYGDISYRLFAEDKAENILIDIVEHFTLIPKYRLMEIVESIDDKLLLALRALVTDKTKSADLVDVAHLETFNLFIKFIDKHECLGVTLFNLGFKDIELRDLFSLSPINIRDEITKNIALKPAQTALDVISIMLLCVDTYNEPLAKLKANTDIFFENLAKYISIDKTIGNIYSDFETFKSNYLKGMVEA
jgi:hypothetical protein